MCFKVDFGGYCRLASWGLTICDRIVIRKLDKDVSRKLQLTNNLMLVCTIEKDPVPVMALMSYTSTPCSTTDFSPTELSMRRKIRITLPTLKKNLTIKWPNMTYFRDKVEMRRWNKLTTSTVTMELGLYLPCNQEMLHSARWTMKSHAPCQQSSQEWASLWLSEDLTNVEMSQFELTNSSCTAKTAVLLLSSYLFLLW